MPDLTLSELISPSVFSKMFVKVCCKYFSHDRDHFAMTYMDTWENYGHYRTFFTEKSIRLLKQDEFIIVGLLFVVFFYVLFSH